MELVNNNHDNNNNNNNNNTVVLTTKLPLETVVNSSPETLCKKNNFDRGHSPKNLY